MFGAKAKLGSGVRVQPHTGQILPPLGFALGGVCIAHPATPLSYRNILKAVSAQPARVIIRRRRPRISDLMNDLRSRDASTIAAQESSAE